MPMFRMVSSTGSRLRAGGAADMRLRPARPAAHLAASDHDAMGPLRLREALAKAHKLIFVDVGDSRC